MAVPGTSGVFAKISIGTQIAASTATEFAADTFTQITGITGIGAFGDEAKIIEYETLEDGRTHKVQGTRNAGDVEVSVIYKPDDAGQVALIAAFDAGGEFNFRVELNNALTSGAGPHHGEYFYFRGIVSSKALDAIDSNKVVQMKAKVAISSAIVNVLPA